MSSIRPHLRTKARTTNTALLFLMAISLLACSPEPPKDVPADTVAVSNSAQKVEGEVISYEWEVFDEFGDTAIPPGFQEPYLLNEEDPAALEALRVRNPGAEIVFLGGLPLVRNVSPETVSNLDVPVSLDLTKPTLSDVLLEINRQINCDPLYGEFNSLSVQVPLERKIWFPPSFLHETIGDRFQFSNVPAREALFESFRRSSLSVRLRYWNDYLPHRYGSESKHISFMTIEFFEHGRNVSESETPFPRSTYIPSWVKEDEILSDEAMKAWSRAWDKSNKPMKYGACGEVGEEADQGIIDAH